jgi:hypothetical protein
MIFYIMKTFYRDQEKLLFSSIHESEAVLTGYGLPGCRLLGNGLPGYGPTLRHKSKTSYTHKSASTGMSYKMQSATHMAYTKAPFAGSVSRALVGA